MNIHIRSIQKSLSKRIITSDELDRQLHLDKNSIENSSGVKKRHWISEDDTVASHAADALLKALKAASLEPKDLDLLISAGAAFDYPVPHNSAIIKSKICDDSISFPCFDVDATCLSFLNALEIAHLYLQSGKCSRIAIVCSEVASRALTPTDPKTYGLFGDAAVAIILETSNEKGYTPIYEKFVNYPSGAMLANLQIGGVAFRGRHESPDHRAYFFEMDGHNLIRLTLKHLEGFIDSMESQTGIKLQDVDYIVAHQTSKFGNEYFIRHFNLNPNQCVNTLEEYGNCISASIPLGLEILVNSTDLRGKKILLIGSGAGLSLGAMVLEF